MLRFASTLGLLAAVGSATAAHVGDGRVFVRHSSVEIIRIVEVGGQAPAMAVQFGYGNEGTRKADAALAIFGGKLLDPDASKRIPFLAYPGRVYTPKQQQLNVAFESTGNITYGSEWLEEVDGQTVLRKAGRETCDQIATRLTPYISDMHLINVHTASETLITTLGYRAKWNQTNAVTSRTNELKLQWSGRVIDGRKPLVFEKGNHPEVFTVATKPHKNAYWNVGGVILKINRAAHDAMNAPVSDG